MVTNPCSSPHKDQFKALVTPILLYVKVSTISVDKKQHNENDNDDKSQSSAWQEELDKDNAIQQFSYTYFIVL